MKERPILFSAAMVRAILEGRKTQTRRIVKADMGRETNVVEWNTAERAFVPWRWHTGGSPAGGQRTGKPFACPYGQPGDRLWVRETHARFSVGEGLDTPVPECVAYRATCSKGESFDYTNSRGEVMRLKVTKWTPAIYMPRWASRIELDITGVRVQRLWDITDADALAEGVFDEEVGWHKEKFRSLWTQINGIESWPSNPWVWVVEFRRVEAQERAA